MKKYWPKIQFQRLFSKYSDYTRIILIFIVVVVVLAMWLQLFFLATYLQQRIQSTTDTGILSIASNSHLFSSLSEKCLGCLFDSFNGHPFVLWTSEHTTTALEAQSKFVQSYTNCNPLESNFPLQVKEQKFWRDKRQCEMNSR